MVIYINRRSSCCCCCCGSNNQLSDIERNNGYNRQIFSQNEQPLKQKVVIIELTEVIWQTPSTQPRSVLFVEDISEGDKWDHYRWSQAFSSKMQMNG